MVTFWEIGNALGSVVDKITDQNYKQSLACFRFWIKTGQTYCQPVPDDPLEPGYSKTLSDYILGAFVGHERTTTLTGPGRSTRGASPLVHPAAHLILRLARDVESDHLLAPHGEGFRTRLSAKILLEFFRTNLTLVRGDSYPNHSQSFRTNTNLIAHCINLGHVEEDAIRNHIIQSLTAHPTLYDHQADALIILFKLAGATFETYADPSVVDRCFDLLKDHDFRDPAKKELMEEVVALRERGWEGLPPPPVFVTRRAEPTDADQKDSSATPVATPLGLSSRDFEPRIPQPPPLGSVTSETDTVPVSPITRSPSTDFSTLSDFTITDPSDDGSPIEPTTLTPHDTFYLEDGNAEVLCGNTLFRVHTSVLSFHSPALRRMFAQTSLASAEPPGTCPRIRSSDTATDFAMLLKTIYLPGFPERNKVPDFNTFSSLLRITAKYELPAVRSQLLEVVRDAYPETPEGLVPSKPLGESIFSGPTPHPNAVLNLLVQQKLGSALPMAYYMAVRRGLDSLMNKRLPQSATLSPEVLQSAIRGLIKLRETERDETYRLIFGPKNSHPCSTQNCPSYAPASTLTSQAYQKIFDHIVGSSQLGTKVLQVPEFYEDCGGGPQCVSPGICRSCVERWESGLADLRRKVWGKLPDVFGLRG